MSAGTCDALRADAAFFVHCLVVRNTHLHSSRKQPRWDPHAATAAAAWRRVRLFGSASALVKDELFEHSTSEPPINNVL
jgi:hypothetical protein